MNGLELVGVSWTPGNPPVAQSSIRQQRSDQLVERTKGENEPRGWIGLPKKFLLAKVTQLSPQWSFPW